MALAQQFDALEFESLYFPYNRILSELSPKRRLVRGRNTAITLGGKLVKRPGIVEAAPSTPFDKNYINKRPARLWIYETQESPPKVYILASVWNATTSRYEMFYNRPSMNTGWVSMGTVRSLSNSTYPHHVVFQRGLAFIKSFPPSTSTDKFGTAIFDGSGTSPTVRLWGIPGPTTPARIKGAVTNLVGNVNPLQTTITVASSAGFPAPPFNIQVGVENMRVTAVVGTTWTVTRGQRRTFPQDHPDKETVLWQDFAASPYRVDVSIGWLYTYAYKSSTGHISNRAPLETSPTQLPSSTGPFIDLLPRITIAGHSDTTNIPTIVIYRSTDGGGTFYKLKEITNTGAANITYVDDSFSGNPVPDSELNFADIAPSQTSNSPPPTVLPPKVVGTDTPDVSTRMVSYQGRIFYAIGNVLFYSAQEEVASGVPEEAWPSGLRGNYFRLSKPITNLAATTEALYIFTLNEIHVLSGGTRETFNISPLSKSIGMVPFQDEAIVSFEDSIAFLTHDFRVAIISGQKVHVISNPVFTDIIDVANADTAVVFTLRYFSDMEKRWLILNADNKKIQWVYDLNLSELLKEDFWYTPWTIDSTTMTIGRIFENLSQTRLIFGIRSADDSLFALGRLDPTYRTGTDFQPSSTESKKIGFDFYFDTYLMKVPSGNHLNDLRRPAMVPAVYAVSFDRSWFPGDTDPSVSYYKDDFWSDPISAHLYEDPARRGLSKSYRTIIVPINEVAYHLAIRMSKPASSDLFELQNLTVIWLPLSGA